MITSSQASSQITIKRKSQLMENNVPLDILVNGYLAYQLKNGETKSINVYTQDEIILQAHLMMNKTQSLPVSLSEREEYIFEIEHVMTNAIFIIGILLAVVSTILIFTTNNLYYMLLVAPHAIYHLYTKYYRKDHYLKIKKIKKRIVATSQ